MSNPALPDKPVDGRTARRSETRAAILQAATGLFAARGVEATSVDEIAAAANTAKGSIYYNFSSKSGLVSALIERSINDVLKAIEANTEGLRGKDARYAMISTLLQELENYPNVARVMISELFRTESEWRDQLNRWRAVLVLTMSKYYQEESLDDFPLYLCDLKASAAVGATLMTAMEWLGFHPELSFDEVINSVLMALRD